MAGGTHADAHYLAVSLLYWGGPAKVALTIHTTAQGTRALDIGRSVAGLPSCECRKMDSQGSLASLGGGLTGKCSSLDIISY